MQLVGAEIKSLQSNLTLEQIFEREVNLRLEVTDVDACVLVLIS